MIQAEIGDFNRFSSPDKILAFAGLSPTTYQSGNFISSNAKMDKRGSRYLRYALFISAQYVAFGVLFSKITTERNAQKASITL